MAFFRQSQIRKERIGWSWRLWWGEATFITAPGWYPTEHGQKSHKCQGRTLTRKGAIRKSEKHLQKHLYPKRRSRGWIIIKRGVNG